MRIASLVLVALVVGIAGCSEDGGGDGEPAGDSSSSSTAPTSGGPQPGQTVAITVAAVGTYPVDPAFDPESLSVPAGANVTVTFRNEDANRLVQHDWVVEGIAGASSSNIGSGATDEVTFTAPTQAGTHAYYCSIGDHRARGMEGTLTITAA